MDDKKKDSQISISLIKERDADELPITYIPVFEDHPWHQEYECSCGAGPYSFGCKRVTGAPFSCEEFVSGRILPIKDEDAKCQKCNERLSQNLKPVYTHDSVKKEFIEALSREGFYGLKAIRFGKLVGFCWGYRYPTDNLRRQSASTSTDWYQKAIPLLEKRNIDPNQIFYHNECGVLYEHRQSRIASRLLKTMLTYVKSHYRYMLFKTINEYLIRSYEAILGMPRGTLKPAFAGEILGRRSTCYIIDIQNNLAIE